jgi:RNA polymerase sigma factor (sigma-70 family)
MGEGRLRNVIWGLRRAVGPSGGGLTDAELLRRWVAGRDQAAFEALLWRHGPAVLGVCRRILHDVHDAEDAAQATFLVLARKGGSVGRRQAVAAWLHTVAYRVALRARDRRPHATVLTAPDLAALPARPTEDPVWRDLRPVLDEEISRLPEKYRAPFVLCCVEGRTNEEAAREMACPVGTILSRLARARERLRQRLTRRGVTLTAGALAAALAAEEATAALPGVLVRTTVSAAALAVAGKGLVGVVSTEVVSLAEGVVRTMLLTKVKVATAVVLGLAVLGGSGTMLGYGRVLGEPGDQAPAAQAGRTAPPSEEKLKALLAEKEKEISDLKARIAALEEDSRVKALRAEKLAREAQAQAERALVAEQEAREQAEQARKQAEDARAVLKSVEAKAALATDKAVPGSGRDGERKAPTSSAPVGGIPTGIVEQARDEVELLEVQLLAKRAQENAAKLTLKEMSDLAAVTPADAKQRVEMAALTGQMEVKAAEVKEAEVRLAQAKRRLARLQGHAEPAPDPSRQQTDQRAKDLELKIDALKKELDNLRKDLERQRPARP